LLKPAPMNITLKPSKKIKAEETGITIDLYSYNGPLMDEELHSVGKLHAIITWT
jgi:hypothetical protein